MARLNHLELLLMQSAPRRWVQQRWELPRLTRMLHRNGVVLTGRRLLEVGCGAGFGTRLLQQAFHPSRLVGFDLMPEQVERARALHVPGAEIRVGDVARIEEPDAAFDGVFVFGILHHVPGWRAALREIARTIAPGGVLYVEEIHGRAARAFDRFVGTAHPKEAFFDWPTFREGLRDAGLDVVDESRLAWEIARAFLARKRP